MKKLSSADEVRLADIIARLEGGKQSLADGHADLVLAIGEYNAKVAAYNEVVEEAEAVVQDLVNEMDEYLGGRSERWLEGDAGQAYSGWKDTFEAIEFEKVEDAEEPDLPDPALYQELTDLPKEPEG
jgi:hypothetical protein